MKEVGASLLSASLGNRAVVVGAGIAGLLATRVLSELFDEVVLVDRDDFPPVPRARSGVPQGKHLHALLPGGMQVGSELFGGLADDLIATGAVRGLFGDLAFYFPEGRSYSLLEYEPEPPPYSIDLEFYVQTRALFEHCVRQRVGAIPNVVTRQAAVRDPVMNGTRVAGVVLDGEELGAELTIDASGRSSRCTYWLPKMGYDNPPESVVNIDFAYASAFFQPKDADALEGCGFFVLTAQEGPYVQRAGALMRVEHGMWLCSLAGRFGDYPPADMAGFHDYAKTLSHPILSGLLASAEPLTEPARYRFPRSIRRHFERLERFPDGVLPIGDAICHFNPIYGQGMSAAARQARALGDLLAARADEGRGLDGIARDWFRVAYEETRGPWVFAAAADFQNPLTTGDFPADEMPALQGLLSLMEASRTDAEAGRLLADLRTLTKPLSDLAKSPWGAQLESSKVN